MSEECAPYGTHLSFSDTPAEAAARLQRVFTASGCRTQADLAQFLGVLQSSVSDAKRRGVIPPQWLLTFLFKKSINPEWILTGKGALYMRPVEHNKPDMPPTFPATNTLIPAGLSTDILLAELVRRALGELKQT